MAAFRLLRAAPVLLAALAVAAALRAADRFAAFRFDVDLCFSEADLADALSVPDAA